MYLYFYLILAVFFFDLQDLSTYVRRVPKQCADI